MNPSFPNRIHPVAKQINGYDQLRWKKENALSEENTVIKLTDFLQNYEKKPIFIAFNSWFDAAFGAHAVLWVLVGVGVLATLSALKLPDVSGDTSA